jgi:kinesin family member 18/19
VVTNDENAAEEDSESAKRHHDAFAAPAPEAAVLRENVAPPQAQAPSKNSHDVAFVRQREPQEKENVVLRAGNVMSCPIKKAAPAIPVLPMIPAPQARKLLLGCAFGGKLKAARDARARFWCL